MKDFFRTLFGIRAKRRAPPITPWPQPGGSIIRNGYKIKVNVACRPELWDWLQLSGWRATPVPQDRRACTMLPDDTLARLNAACTEEREQILTGLLADARRRPTPRTRP